MRLTALVSISLLAGAQTLKLPGPAHAVWELAGAAPPEFAADALLRIAESNQVADRNARLELAEKAFQLASSAKFPVRMLGLSGTTMDTASGSLSEAYNLKLDTLSLQSRAVRDILPLDAAKARDLFGRIIRPALRPLTCDDALVWEPSDYYQALSAVANSAFTQKEKARQEHINLLLDALGQASSPFELIGLAAAVRNAAVTAAEHQLLWVRFNGTLENLQTDGRSFAASIGALAALNTPGIQSSLEKYRRNPGCEGDTAKPPDKTPTTPKLERYWQSATARQLRDAGLKLRIGPNERLLSDADRMTPEWQRQLADYLNLIADWTPDQEPSEAVYYHEKCLVYIALLDLVPPGPQGEKILAEFVDFIGNSALYQRSPAEWFIEPHRLMNRAQSDPGLHAKILQAFENSGNPVLVLTVALEKLSNHT
jgi:hypothetical protein